MPNTYVCVKWRVIVYYVLKKQKRWDMLGSALVAIITIHSCCLPTLVGLLLAFWRLGHKEKCDMNSYYPHVHVYNKIGTCTVHVSVL